MGVVPQQPGIPDIGCYGLNIIHKSFNMGGLFTQQWIQLIV